MRSMRVSRSKLLALIAAATLLTSFSGVSSQGAQSVSAQATLGQSNRDSEDVVVEIVELATEDLLQPVMETLPPTTVPRQSPGDLLGAERDDPGGGVYGALFRPSQQGHELGVVVVPGLSENFYDARYTALARSLARAGYLTLVLNMRRHDQEFQEYGLDNGVEDIRAAVEHLGKWGVRRVYLVGHDFGGNEVVLYSHVERTHFAQPRTPVPVVASIGLYGTYSSPPDPHRLLAMTTEERDAMMPLAQSLVAYHDGRHAYLMGPQGAAEAESQWAVEAGTLWDYFGGGTAQVSELLAQIESEGMPVLRIPGPEWDDRTLSWIRARLGPEVWLPEPLKDPKVDEGYYYCETPATEILRVRTPEGVELAGVRYTPAPERRPREEAIVLIHGASENFYSDAMFWLGRCLAQEGFTVVALNRSDADDGFDTANFENTVLDVQAAVNALAGYRHIYLLGHSLGSVVAAAYVAQHPDPAIAGLILAAPPASYETFRIAHVDSQSYRDVARVAYGSEDPSRWLFLRWCGEIDRETQRCDARTAMLTRHSAGQFRSYLDGYATADTIANIRRVTVPVLILRSEADQVTTCQDAMAVFANAVQSPATALVEVFDKDLDSTGSRYELRSSRIGHSLVILLPIHWGGRVFSEWIDFRGMRAPSEHSHDPETSVTLDPRLRVLFSQRDASYDSSYAKAGGSRLVTGHPCIG